MKSGVLIGNPCDGGPVRMGEPLRHGRDEVSCTRPATGIGTEASSAAASTSLGSHRAIFATVSPV